MTDSSEKATLASNEYNERYSRKVPIQLGDLEQFVMAFGVVDDYIEWMRFFKGVDIPGNGPAVIKQLKEARTLALALYNAPPPSETREQRTRQAPIADDKLTLEVALREAERCRRYPDPVLNEQVIVVLADALHAQKANSVAGEKS